MSKPDDMPTIQLDQEDREAYLHKRSKQPKQTVTDKEPAPKQTSAKGGNKGLVIFTLLLALGALAASGWLFQQTRLQQSSLVEAQDRIQELENKLSATGEEMGESTVALQAKLKAVTEKTDELWEQMDKLWASAWRKNQSEIQSLATTVDKLSKGQQDTSQKARLLESDISLAATRLTAIEEQFSKLQAGQDRMQSSLQALSAEQPKLSSQLDEIRAGLRESRQSLQELGLRLTDLEDIVKRPTAMVQPLPPGPGAEDPTTVGQPE
ncbi:hypothetical protein [Bowmanella dokdonensis]|uniref:Uncharacterized protein n=1 Tax=Bowmanella dokdonensis TaxID=751969 RepID=A0A939IPV7_9ALTE|nr:hypothetical protein [Bowmanella dokdonensis]MBN7823967.1 hypothetical protein [Bowmanella dokdonensis]